MAKLFSFASWNVEHFSGHKERAERVVNFIQKSSPDVFGIMEVERREVFDYFMRQMPDHSFFMTEDISGMETLVGVHNRFQSFVTQKQDLKSKVPTLRPGALATIRANDQLYTLLFLHMKSFQDPRSWGLRGDMVEHVRRLKTSLDGRYGTAERGANFICLGDMNTMGMNVTFANNDASGSDELSRYEKMLARKDMTLLSKTYPSTWWNGNGEEAQRSSNLDHVFASKHLQFNDLEGSQISVRGWTQLATAASKKQWISTHSDHALIYGEVLA